MSLYGPEISSILSDNLLLQFFDKIFVKITYDINIGSYLTLSSLVCEDEVASFSSVKVCPWPKIDQNWIYQIWSEIYYILPEFYQNWHEIYQNLYEIYYKLPEIDHNWPEIDQKWSEIYQKLPEIY